MQQIIKDREIVTSPWVVIGKDEPVPDAGHILLPLKVFLDDAGAYKGRDDIGVWLDSDEEVEEIASLAQDIPVIALNFPSFFDGRSLSSANLLRRKYGFTGELRAIGDVRRDQLDQMQRCGINAFSLAEGQDFDAAIESLRGFTYNYQGSIDRPVPLFRRREAQGQ